MLEKQYLKEQKEKILCLARDLYNDWEITYNQLQDSYYYNFITNYKTYV